MTMQKELHVLISLQNDMNHVMRKPIFWISDQVQQKNQAVQPRKMARALIVRIFTIYEAKTNPISFVFIFTYAKSRFSQDTVFINKLQLTKIWFYHAVSQIRTLSVLVSLYQNFICLRRKTVFDTLTTSEGSKHFMNYFSDIRGGFNI